MMSEPANVGVAVYNLLGQVVWKQVDHLQPAGMHTLQWNKTASTTSSAYVVRLVADKESMTIKILWVK